MTHAAQMAFVFPGQGSQSLGMLAELATSTELVRETFEEASSAVGIDLWTLAQTGPRELLDRTENTQPALLASSVSIWRVWQARGGAQPSLLAGHSLGEYSALVAAGAMSLSAAAALVAERGRLMQAAVADGDGAMAAVIGLEDVQVIEVCQQAAAGEVVAAANFNAPGQVVIAGAATAVARAAELARQAGARRVLPLAVSVPSHCELMRPAAAELARRLADVQIDTPQIPVLHNADVVHHGEASAIRDALVRQLYQPVRWVEIVQLMAAQGISRVAECGPGKVLTGLVRRIDRRLETHALGDADSIEQILMAWS